VSFSFALRFKGLAYKTHWLGYADIEPVAKSLGVTPTGTKPDGTPRYTIPFIYDSTTNKFVSNSFDIIEYLDSTYPNTVTFIPPETRLLQNVFEQSQSTLLGQLDPVFRSHFPNSKILPQNLKLVQSLGLLSTLTKEEEKEAWKKFKNALDELSKFAKDEGPFVMGKKVSAADAVLFGRLACYRWMWEETDEWKDLMTWQGGRWRRLFEAYESLPQVEKCDEYEVE
jgi:glutathione S-transferase